MAKREQSEPTTEARNGDWILPTYHYLQEKIRSSVASSSRLADEDHQFPPPKQINDYVYEVCTPEGRPSVDIVFFHGLQLEHHSSNDPHITTWVSRNKSELWLNWLVDDEDLRDARILTICYDASLKRTNDMGRMDMYVIVENLIHCLTGRTAGVGQDGCPVVLVGHCLGGLVMKELCVQARSLIGRPGQRNVENFLHSVKGFFTYSSPHQGTRLADNNTWSGKGPLFEGLSTQNKSASRQNEEFRKLRQEYGWKVFGVVENLPVNLGSLGFKGMVVEEASARHDVDDFYTISENHFDICRPKSTTCNSFQLLLDFVIKVVRKDKVGVSTNLLTDDELNTIVDIDSRVNDVVKKLDTNQRLGIVGFGGMGKTTLAKAVCDKISESFEYVCFFEEVKSKMAKEESGDHLRAQITERLKWKGRSVGESFDWDQLRRKKVLICLDDAKYESQVRVMLPADDFSEESRVIVTSRQRDFLRKQGFEIHDATRLDLYHSEKLFCLHAFDELEVPQPYKERMSSFVTSFTKKCDGHPLALKVSGRYLSMDKDDEELWEGALKKLSNAQPLSGDIDVEDDLWSIVTVEALAPAEREMFLDAATFLHGQSMKQAQMIWATCSWAEGRTGWKNLVDRCLVSQNRSKEIMVHDLLRELGRKEAGHSRVSNVSETMQLRQEERPTVKYLEIEFPDHLPGDSVPYVGDGVRIFPSVIWKLPAPEFLQSWGGYILQIWGGYLGDGVRIFRSVILKLPALEFLEMRGSGSTQDSGSIQEGDVRLEAVRHLEITFCDLETCKLSALRYLKIHWCSFLTKLPKEVGQLRSLRHLEISCCTNLKALPDSIGNLRALEVLKIIECENLEALPESVSQLKALRHLKIQFCHSLKALPKGVSQLQALRYLKIVGCFSLEALPDNIGNLRNLTDLSIIFCEKLRVLPEGVGELRKLETLQIPHLRGTPESICQLKALRKLTLGSPSLGLSMDDDFSFPDTLGPLHKLETLIFEEMPFKEFPEFIGQLRALQHLKFSSCKSLKVIPDFIGQLTQLRHLEFSWCESLETPPSSLLEKLHALQQLTIYRCKFITKAPEWATQYGVRVDFRK